MEENEQLVMEKWSDWKSSFFETNGTFSALPVYQDSDTKRKCKDFSLEYPFAKKDFDTELDEKIEACFFWRKMNCNFNEFQYCLRVPSMWEFQSVMLQQIYFRKNFVFSDPGETRIEKNWRSWKKFNYLPLSSEISTDL